MEKMAIYRKERKESVLQKLLPPLHTLPSEAALKSFIEKELKEGGTA